MLERVWTLVSRPVCAVFLQFRVDRSAKEVSDVSDCLASNSLRPVNPLDHALVSAHPAPDDPVEYEPRDWIPAEIRDDLHSCGHQIRDSVSGSLLLNPNGWMRGNSLITFLATNCPTLILLEVGHEWGMMQLLKSHDQR